MKVTLCLVVPPSVADRGSTIVAVVLFYAEEESSLAPVSEPTTVFLLAFIDLLL